MVKAMFGFLPRELPREIAALGDLALDLRWTWSYEGDGLWKRFDEEAWNRTRNPWILLQDISEQRLEQNSLQAIARSQRNWHALQQCDRVT